jgi:hypothetical protein
MNIGEQTVAIFFLSFFLSGGKYSIFNKFLSHLTSLHVGHVVIGCKKTMKNGLGGLK